jgi:CBS domain-containing protein
MRLILLNLRLSSCRIKVKTFFYPEARFEEFFRLNEKDRSIISVQQNATVYDPLKLMVKNNIGAIFVKDNDNIVGIYTERDLMEETV